MPIGRRSFDGTAHYALPHSIQNVGKSVIRASSLPLAPTGARNQLFARAAVWNAQTELKALNRYRGGFNSGPLMQGKLFFLQLSYSGGGR
jgi:hypothetical protein